MPDTTPGRVRSIAKHLKSVGNEDLLVYIDDAKLQVADMNVPERYYEYLQRYLAAHLATLNVPRPTNKKVSDLSISYNRPSGNELEATEYGQEVKRMLGKLKGTASLQVF